LFAWEAEVESKCLLEILIFVDVKVTDIKKYHNGSRGGIIFSGPSSISLRA
jgi:hypothetical protein